MSIRNGVTLGVLLLLVAGQARATAETLVGAVTTVSPASIHLKTIDDGIRELVIDDKTQYVKWITHQPWQQSTVADKSFLKVGRCISVESRSGDDRVAKLIRVNTDEIGTIWCPCRVAR